MADTEDCPAGCGRTKPRGHLVCHLCWYILADHLKRAYLDARRALDTDRSRRAIDAMRDAKQNAINSINPNQGL